MSLSDEDALRIRVKAELRKRMRAVRRTLPQESAAERSRRIVEAVLSLDCVTSASAVALYAPMLDRREVDVRPLDAALRARNVRIAYPAIEPDSGAMSFRFADDPNDLQEAGFGFLEPPATAPLASRGELGVVIVPALAADPAGHRIGYGAGYYDRTLTTVAPPAITVAVVYDWQLVAEVPAMANDVAVDWIVTDARVVRAESPG